MPSIWAWQVIWWALGVFVIWYLASRMEMATWPVRAAEAGVLEMRTAESAPLTYGNGRIVIGLQWRWALALAVVGAIIVKWVFG